MAENIGAGILGAVLFLTLGLVCLCVPEWIQRIALGYYRRHPLAAKLNPFPWWIESQWYVPTTRVVGAVAAGVGFLLAAATIWVLVCGG